MPYHSGMNDQLITIYQPEKIAERIRACRTELRALTRLHKMALAAKEAEEAQNSRDSLVRRQGVPK
jgi:hypothetical protein